MTKLRIAGELDIVVLSHDDAPSLRRCIDSVRDNTPGTYNLIIVDLHSTDGSREWLEDSKVASHLIVNKRNVGLARGRNQGIRVGRYPWVALIDQTVEIKDTEWLDKLWNYTIDRRIGFVESRVLKGPDFSQPSFGGLAFCLVRRTCFEEVGLFDRTFKRNPDEEWLVRLEWSRWAVGYCPDTIATVHASLDNEKSNSLLRMKYSEDFLDMTLKKYLERRLEKESALLQGDKTLVESDGQKSKGTVTRNRDLKGVIT